MENPSREHPHESSQLPNTPDVLEPRRDFLKTVIGGTVALSSLPTMATAQQHDHHAEHGHQDMRPLLAKELAHPFNQDPGKWLDTHEKEWQECFDCSNEPVTEITVVCIDERMELEAITQSGKRVLRVAGSGILWEDIDVFVDALERQVQVLANDRPVSAIRVRISSHGDEKGTGCGAAGIKFSGEENPDQCARDFLRDVAVPKLKERGINAEFIGDKKMRKGPHTGIAAAIDCTDGRLQRLPGLNAFTVSDPDNVTEAVKDAVLALKIASGSHAYGDMLKQFTFLVFSDPAHPEKAKTIIAALEEQTKPYKAKGMEIRIVERRAPAVR